MARAPQINFLCVHKKLRAKRLAPVLIKEVTRRVNLSGVWQAVYTAGVVLPLPVAVCRYWHRSLNPRKLVEVGFSRVPPGSTLQRLQKHCRLPPAAALPGSLVRPMAPDDVPAVTALLRAYLGGAAAAAGPHAPAAGAGDAGGGGGGAAPAASAGPRYALHPVLSEAEVAHWLLPRDKVVYSYVACPQAGGGGAPTDFFSFYSLPSTVIAHPVHSSLRAAYCFYYAPGTHGPAALLGAALAAAAAEGFDVFNALDTLANRRARVGCISLSLCVCAGLAETNGARFCCL